MATLNQDTDQQVNPAPAEDTDQRVTPMPGELCLVCVHAAECPADERGAVIYCADFTRRPADDQFEEYTPSEPGELCRLCVNPLCSLDDADKQNEVLVTCVDFVQDEKHPLPAVGGLRPPQVDVPFPCFRCRHVGTVFCTVCRFDPSNRLDCGADVCSAV